VKQYKAISEELIYQFIDWGNGFLNSNQMEELLGTIDYEFGKYFISREQESNLIRIINSVIDKRNFLLDCLRFPHHAEILCAISTCSNYLSDILVRNPELMYQLFNESYLNEEITTELLNKEITRGLTVFRKDKSKIKFLQSLKRKSILRIGVKDILSLTETRQIIKEISVVAYTINTALFELSYKTVLEQNNIKSTIRRYCLMSLGKLGGYELNYSSDIDLMVIYDKDTLVGSLKKIYFSEILTQTINKYTQWATEFNELGNLYRVDFRLRPDGNVAPLSSSLLNTINYYETRGEQWEKQMLIKLNFVAGDKKLFEEFKKFVHAYIYRISAFETPLTTIAKMKANIEKQYTNQSNIKTTIGGIRDIEFAVQGLQLINGKINDDLRNGNTLETLLLLKDNNLIDNNEFNTLSESYIFYRRIEHFLQLMNNTQTHTLPADDNALEQIAKYFNFKTTKSFNKKLATYQKNVRTIFLNIIEPDKKSTSRKHKFNTINFADLQKAEKNLKFLEFGTGLVQKKSFDRSTSDKFNSIKENLLNYLENSRFPDIILENFAKVISGYKFPSILYAEFKNKAILDQFLKVLELSEFSVNLMIQHPPLTENWISKKIFYKNYDSIIESSSYREILYILSCQYVLGLIDEAKISELLSKYISNQISQIFDKHIDSDDYFIAGLGSFALLDLNFKSDIDLIVVVKDIKEQYHLEELVQKSLNELRSLLSPLEIDFRLRPEGKSSQLVWDITNYRKYLEYRAGVWEFQALIKSNFICGSKKLFNSFKDVIYNELVKNPNENIIAQINEMHAKSTQPKFQSLGNSIDLKNSNGSFMTLDYILTLSTISTSNKRKMFIGGRKKIHLMKSLFSNKSQIFENYLFLKKVLFGLQITVNWNKSKLPIDENLFEKLCYFLKLNSSSILKEKILDLFSQNKNFYNSLINENDK
jgi:glutamate-ammonia-ligase adenylyltransferase